MRTRLSIVTVLLAVSLAAARPAVGQGSVATLASVIGPVEVQRAGRGEWRPAALGATVASADAVRVGTAGFAKLLFGDDNVVDLGPSTEVIVEPEHAKGAPRTLLRLRHGVVEAFVGGLAGGAASLEVETPTAVARGDEGTFIVRFAPPGPTEVAGIEGTVAVSGVTGILGPALRLGANESTHVSRDGLPAPPEQLDETQARAMTRGLGMVGTGSADGLAADNSLVDGSMVDARDRLPRAGATEATGLVPGIPGQTLVQTLSPDIRANNQPLPVYRAVPPNRSPNPPH